MKIAFQGIPGAYSEQVCRTTHPQAATLPCATFADVFSVVADGTADMAAVPVENSVAGRVADVYHLLPESGLYITAQHFEKITHCLLALPQATIDTIKYAYSHVQGLTQCRQYLRKRDLTPVLHADTAGAAQHVATLKNPENAAIASALAAEIYGLQILDRDIADAAHNTTRFLFLARQPATLVYQPDIACVTTLIFSLRNIPAALYKALGGFATNGINLSKIESYLSDGGFQAAQFYVDADAHADAPAMRLALEELHFYSTDVRILGTYKSGEL